ncbi:conserved hypothetical protein [Ricinus communis]|uniref:Uncharacterized protein n=1 Tax=Ricinus communis TaxID=3988 RepID=B9TCR3_RICCO|nr:conserved hypothetical protein [Ricinus communis]
MPIKVINPAQHHPCPHQYHDGVADDGDPQSAYDEGGERQQNRDVGHWKMGVAESEPGRRPNKRYRNPNQHTFPSVQSVLHASMQQHDGRQQHQSSADEIAENPA